LPRANAALGKEKAPLTGLFLCRESIWLALGKDFSFFLKKNVCREPSQSSSRQRVFQKKKENSLPSATVIALGKAGKWVFLQFCCPALPSAMTIALGKGSLCREQPSAKWEILFFSFDFPLHYTYKSHSLHMNHIHHV
jgi:hypothetical protein